MTTSPIILDMLGDELRNAVTAAQTRLSDPTIMARIEIGLCLVERGSPAVTLVDKLPYEDAVTYLGALT